MKNPRMCNHVIAMIALICVCAASIALGANPLITIASFDDRTIVQRVSGVGSFAATGAYSGVPTGIEVRAVDSMGNQVCAWQNANLVAATKKWNASLDSIPQGGFYHVEARYKGQADAPVKSINRFGVGIIILITGQSNMAGFCWNYAPTRTPIVPHPLTAHAKLGEWKWIVPPSYPKMATASMLMANNLAEALEIPVGLIHIAVSSTGLREWIGDCYRPVKGNMPFNISEAIAFAGGDIELIIYHQGWADFNPANGHATPVPDSLKSLAWNTPWEVYEEMVASGEVSHLPYKENLDSLYNLVSKQVRRKTGLRMLCGIEGRSFASQHMENNVWGKVTRPPYDWSLAQSKQVDCTRWSQAAWIKDHPQGGALGNTIDLRLYDSGHFRKQDRFILSARYTQSVLHAVGEADFGGGGPSFLPDQTSIVDGGILLKVKHEGGNRLVVPDPAKPIEGFVVRRQGKGQVVPIKKVSIRQPDGVFIELTVKPTTDMLVACLTGPCPISDYTGPDKPREYNTDDAPGNIIYDNAVLPAGNARPGLMLNGSLGWIRASANASVSSVRSVAPAGLRLHTQSGMTSCLMDVGYYLNQSAHVSLRLYNAQGRALFSVVEGHKPAGTHQVRQNIHGLSAGRYFINLKSEGNAVTRQVVVF